MTLNQPSNSRLTRFFALLAVTATAAAFTACDVKKTQEGEAPKVKVEGGQVPKYDVKGPDVDVGKKETTITVPDVKVKPGAEKRAEEEGKAPATPAPAPQ